MELEHSFTVPVPKNRAWDVLLDVERVAPCMPGATLDSVDGDEIHGRIKVKVGPINMTYAGTARFVERDPAAGVVLLEASGKETRGAGTASATVRSVLEDRGDETHVTVLTTLNVTGKPAQFGRGVLNEVGGKLLTIFAANLAATLADADGAGQDKAGHDASGSGTDAAAAATPAAPSAAGPAAGAEISVDDLGLPARVVASLRRAGLATAGRLAGNTEAELLAIDGIGPTYVHDIKTALAGRGLSLGEPPRAEVAAETAQAERVEPEAAAGQAAVQADDAALNLLKVAGLPVLKRALPVLAGLVAALLIALRKWLRRRQAS